MLAWVNGTTLAVAVVPDVERVSARSPSVAKPLAAAGPRRAPSSVNTPASDSCSGVRRMTGMPRFHAAAIAGESSPACATSAETPSSVSWLSNSRAR